MLRAGFATRNITPRPGALFSGSGDMRGRVSVIDGALHVRVALLDDEQGGTLVLGMADVGGFTRGQDRAIREAMAEALNLQIGQVRINASHNHSAPKTYLHFQAKKGGAAGTIFNYACHATSLGGRGELVSPDFPGCAAEAIERETGAPAFFLQGAGGNIGTGKYADSTTEGARRMGDRLARSVLKAMEGMMFLAPAPLSLDAWTERIELDERLPSLEEARKRLDEAVRQGVRNSDLWRGAALLEVLEDAERSRQCELFVVHGGEWSLAGLPAESFVESALAVKSASSCPFPLVGGYYDCTLWYIPTRAAFRDAGFETRGGWNYAAPGTSEQLTCSIIRSIDNGDIL